MLHGLVGGRQIGRILVPSGSSVEHQLLVEVSPVFLLHVRRASFLVPSIHVVFRVGEFGVRFDFRAVLVDVDDLLGTLLAAGVDRLVIVGVARLAVVLGATARLFVLLSGS